ncbi:MAG TPA: tetratricopeptide repeat protein [candidate division WOR-3 bacterium]|uniref:Tetratricopeptide repeat protein n=1 Tax=candidate division WOR-3 bacterium TaxID=2052148 RepID=A0A9C9K0M3_UNCW3|nr:tetratricopeptide repeat protein [candidate division WOR-3 bacterium]
MKQDFQDLLELSDFYILSQRFEEALKVLKKAEKINKLNPKLYYNFGIAYEALNERENAQASYRLALKLNPDFKSAQEHLDRLIER